LPFLAQTNVTLPSANEWKADAQMPTVAGDGFSINFTNTITVDSLAPVVGEWNRTAKPNETITLSGVRFTLRSGINSGSDTRAYIYAQTPAGSVLKNCKILYVNDLLMTVTLPDDIPFGLYLIWIKNEKGVSSPITINKPIARWIGPLGSTTQPGTKKRVFGKNLSFNHAESSSKVFIQTAGGAFTECTVTTVEPYSVEFMVPDNLSNGNYKVYVHSGHGGEYGWSEGLDLTIAPKWERGNTVINVLPGENIQNAVNEISALPNGGTVKLMKGLHAMTDILYLQTKVNLEGESRDSSILQLPRIYITNSADNQYISIQNLTVRPAAAGICKVVSQSTTGGDRNRDLLFKNVKFVLHPYPADSTSTVSTFIETERFEVTECEFNAKLNFYGTDIWIHNNQFNGGRGERDGAMAYIDGNNVASSGRLVIENNEAGTPNWPNKAGNRNYTEFLSGGQINRLIWCSRLIYFQVLNLSVENIYIARNKTTDCAIQDNKGEQILFHSNWGPFAQVNNAVGRNVEIRTNGKIYGSAVAFNPEVIPLQALTAMTTVPDKFQAGNTIDNKAYLVILNGKGKGQYNKVESHTSNTITVKNEWRIQPDSTSIILLTYTTMNATVYKNDLSGFPVGYRDLGIATASCGISTESTINTSIESNTVNRTMSSYSLQGYDLSPCFWNEGRENISTNTYRNGTRIVARTGDWSSTSIRAISPVLMGTWVRNDDSQSLGGAELIGLGRGDTQSNLSLIQGSGIENSVFKKGINVAGNSEGLIFRNNVLGGTSATLKKYSNAIFSNNGTGTFSASTNLFKDKIIPEYRALDFSTDNVDAEIEVPILNGGVTSWAFSVLSASQPWIVATVKDGTSTIAQESNSGKVLVRIDKTKLPAGNQQGIITLTNVNGLQNTIGVFYTDPNYTGVDQLTDKLFSVYPSPFSNQLNIKGEGIKGYELYNLSGQVLLSQKTSGESVLINTQSLSKGAYVIKIDTDKGVLFKKVVK
jgi:hypothetical protein